MESAWLLAHNCFLLAIVRCGSELHSPRKQRNTHDDARCNREFSECRQGRQMRSYEINNVHVAATVRLTQSVGPPSLDERAHPYGQSIT